MTESKDTHGPLDRRELERIQELYAMNLAPDRPDAILDRFCEKVARFFNVSSCVVTIVLEDRQWFRSFYGLPDELARARQTSRQESFCTHVVASQQPLIVPNIQADENFRTNPLALRHGFLFYAGFPLSTGEGHVVGSLCLYDTRPREFPETDLRLLQLFSERVVAHFELCHELEKVQVEVAERRRMEEEHKGTISLLKATLDATADGILVVDLRGKIISFNQQFARMWRIPAGILKTGDDDRALAFVVDQLAEPEAFIRRVRELYSQPEAESYDVLEFKDGRVLERFSMPQKIDGAPVGRVWSFRDITQRRRAEAVLHENAIRDVLTGLYNRRFFDRRIEEEIARAARSGGQLTMLLCDLDQFKKINDARGHHAGDEALRAIAQSIRGATRGSDLVFRWGGDEIVVILPGGTREGALIAARRIREGVQSAGRECGLSLDLSIGIAFYPDHGGEINGLLRVADRALYIAKNSGDKFHIGEDEYHLDPGSINTVFQPLVDLRSNRIVGYEALSRDPQGKLSIQEFFQKYRVVGRLEEIKLLCFRLQLEAARKLGLKRLFINVDSGMLSRLRPFALPPGREVILEVSELEAIQEIDRHIQLARRWRKMGFKYAIDDFGTGFVSLPFIARFVPNYVKVDQAMIQHAVVSEKFRKFSRTVLDALRHYVGQAIIAEGIETERQLQMARRMGIHLGQGNRLGRPAELPLPGARVAAARQRRAAS